jgi:predicted nucleic-acid-binding protein
MVAVDTNVLVRLLVRDDPAQTQRSEAFVAEGAWISIIVLVETMWVLKAVYELTPETIADAIEMLLAHDRLTVDAPEAVAAAAQVFRQRPSLGFSDCLVLELARRAGHFPLGTFDRTLGRLEGAKRL